MATKLGYRDSSLYCEGHSTAGEIEVYVGWGLCALFTPACEAEGLFSFWDTSLRMRGVSETVYQVASSGTKSDLPVLVVRLALSLRERNLQHRGS